MGKIIALDGNSAIAYGVMLSKVQLVAAYPITPQTPIVQTISSLIDKGEYDATYINVESEHSAMSAVTGAAAGGVRAFTASASHGLALMHEMTGIVAGSRQTAVMAVVSRALPAPCNLQCDHSDIMGERDQGWIQLFANDPQEALDFIMVAYKTSEDERVLLPTMVDIDGFYVSHLTEPVNIPDREEANRFIDDFKPVNYKIDFDNPMAINNLMSPRVYTEVKYSHKVALENSTAVLEENFAKFNEIFGREYSSIKEYYTENADYIFVCMGSITGSVIKGVEELRSQGIKAGVVRVISFRPFPKKMVKEATKNAKVVSVIDRSHGMGSFAPLYLEVCSSLINSNKDVKLYSFAAGLGGRDVGYKTLLKAFSKVCQYEKEGTIQESTCWIDLKEEGRNNGQ
ncbi:transketolase C-terminal domain-containing protein [Maledivibacter halophilus]|uniref:Pyruvate ferredoxin oxidoreductase alpha subunit n=1 Tax=Maledivibacter halophilus TaxID=36842 RepID=A0A1T5KGK6_9FIRM|nr:transketolase C-terminal domain-containing protein [Maledivibacter halophilus]SKC62842.1 pyruvate ferredoxin oxidoreductase alpha subunit [Maledivibacter halophilus]